MNGYNAPRTARRSGKRPSVCGSRGKAGGVTGEAGIGLGLI